VLLRTVLEQFKSEPVNYITSPDNRSLLYLQYILPNMNFPALLNDNLLKVATGQKPSRIPVWIMRQAGRYLPEFREIRKDHDFFELVNDPELASEVTIQPIKRYDLDAAIIFSDILVIPTAVGLEVKMEPGIGPVLPNPLKTPDDVSKLDFDADVNEKMKGTLAAITLTRHKLNGKVPLLGFVGAPWTLMSYMIEGGGSRTLTKSKSWLYKYPKESTELLSKLTDIVIRYLVAQVIAGAQMVQVFESHADLLGPELFKKFCIPTLSRIRNEVVASLKAKNIEPVPMTIFAKGAHYALNEISQLNYNVVGLDWTVDPKVGRNLVAKDTVLQGNLDPCALFGDKDSLEKNTRNMIDSFGVHNYICNLGHGIYPETPTESVQTIIDTVHSYKL